MDRPYKLFPTLKVWCCSWHAWSRCYTRRRGSLGPCTGSRSPDSSSCDWSHVALDIAFTLKLVSVPGILHSSHPLLLPPPQQGVNTLPQPSYTIGQEGSSWHHHGNCHLVQDLTPGVLHSLPAPRWQLLYQWPDQKHRSSRMFSLWEVII
jgi:hypothetical protein